MQNIQNTLSINDNPKKQIAFTKMHGAGNDFVVLNAVNEPLPLLTTEDYKRFAHRHFGIGCDQILIVAHPQDTINNDFSYRIINNDGSEVEQCGNGARCFMRFVLDKHLTLKKQVRVETAKGIIILSELANGQIEVNMGIPRFDPDSLPFNPVHQDIQAIKDNVYTLLNKNNKNNNINNIDLYIASMGNPHAVLHVNDYPPNIELIGSYIENHPAFPKRVNVGFMCVVNRYLINLRVWERGAGETLACGTGACAAVVIGIKQGLLDSPVQVNMRGGVLNIAWDGTNIGVVNMQGDALTVFEGVIDI